MPNKKGNARRKIKKKEQAKNVALGYVVCRTEMGDARPSEATEEEGRWRGEEWSGVRGEE